MKLVYMSVMDKELSDQRIERVSFFLRSPMKGLCVGFSTQLQDKGFGFYFQ